MDVYHRILFVGGVFFASLKSAECDKVLPTCESYSV